MNAKGGRIGTLQWILSTSIGRKIFWKMLARQNIFNKTLTFLRKKVKQFHLKAFLFSCFFARNQASESLENEGFNGLVDLFFYRSTIVSTFHSLCLYDKSLSPEGHLKTEIQLAP